MKTSSWPLLVGSVLALPASLFLSYGLRFDFALPAETLRTLPLIAAWVIGLKLLCLWRTRQFQVSLDYFTIPDCSRLFYVLTAASLLTFFISWHFGSHYAPPRSVVLADFSFSFLALTGLRVAFRRRPALRLAGGSGLSGRMRRAGIIGAGWVGTGLAQELVMRRELRLQAVAFFDDDPAKWGTRILNIPIVGPPELLRDDEANLELEEVIIAMPSAPARRISEVVKLLQRAGCKFTTVPSLYDLTNRQAKISQLRSVEVEDLLGRDPIQLETEDIRHLLADEVVMVTGAGGSIGSELCRQIAAYEPRQLLLLEQSEVHLFQIEQELITAGYGGCIVPLLANILDRPRMEHIFLQHQPALVFHAAAHKHVPMLESQPSEALKNNAFGTMQLAELALRHEVNRFVFISTDKAINPTNIMGATKRLAEMCLLSLFAEYPHATKFMMVRFGNVLGSSGSVIPIFKKQIAAGGPVTVTHPDMQRYFMTIPEAVGLVLQSAAAGQGGEVFVLDMGQPVKILDLARQLIELSGLKPEKEIQIKFSGLRPGEKLFEELVSKGENIAPTAHPKIMRLRCEPRPLKHMDRLLNKLLQNIHLCSADELKMLLQRAVPEYKPQLKSTPRPAPRPPSPQPAYRDPLMGSSLSVHEDLRLSTSRR